MWQCVPLNKTNLEQFIAYCANHSLRTLPSDADTLSAKLKDYFTDAGSALPKQRIWLLTQNDQLKGISTLNTNAGDHAPFYNYSQDQLIHHSHHLKQNQRINVLHLSHHLSGMIQLGDCIYDDDTPKQYATWLTLVRLFWIEQHQHHLEQDVICELGGDEQHLFWHQVAKPFFNCTLAQANELVLTHGKSIVAELLPFHPIYQPLLSDACQITLGQCSHSVEPQAQLLTKLGFWRTRFIDIFDAGPVYRTSLSHLFAALAKQRCLEGSIGLHQQNGDVWLNEQTRDAVYTLKEVV